ncbi:MAG: 16S rRNA (guanine(527)-N(7))-methyltransferase RsmG [Bdellovibrionales bacterium]|nr:16S rRNA (guanine(527)-N(7))-methyltransferase RsmG [Bdellovibrionales bacterium]
MVIASSEGRRGAPSIPTQEQTRLLSEFSEQVSHASERINILSRRELLNIEAHIADSLLLAPHLPSESCSILDLGSGGGFPLVPLSIVSPHASFTGVDSSLRKCQFVEFAARKLKISNLLMLHARIEELTELHGSFRVITARALKPLSELLQLAAPFMHQHSELLFLKGPNYKQELQDSVDSLATLGLHLVKEIAHEVPNKGTSVILGFMKSEATASGWPMRANTNKQ